MKKEYREVHAEIRLTAIMLIIYAVRLLFAAKTLKRIAPCTKEKTNN